MSNTTLLASGNIIGIILIVVLLIAIVLPIVLFRDKKKGDGQIIKKLYAEKKELESENRELKVIRDVQQSEIERLRSSLAEINLEVLKGM